MEEKKEEGCSGCGQKQMSSTNENSNSVSQQNVPCRECHKKSFKGKLGTCIDCIVANIIGSLFGWIAFTCFFFLYPEKRLLVGALFVAGSFTLLLSAHGIAYLVKRNRRIS